MTNYVLRPEVAGGLGEATVMDTSVHPPVVRRLDYELDDWSGDDFLGTFPCVIVTERLRTALEQSSLTGFTFADVHVSTSLNFDEFFTGTLPPFSWLQATGMPGEDNVWTGARGRLVVDDAAISLLRRFTMGNCTVEEVA